jgi:hypothetical protein
LKKNTGEDEIHDQSCMFRDNLIVLAARHHLVVWKYDAAAEDGIEKVLMPIWDVPLEPSEFPFLSTTYGNNKVFVKQAGSRVKFLCLLTGAINYVNLSEDLCTGDNYVLNYPVLQFSNMSPCDMRFGLLTENPLKRYFSSIPEDERLRLSPDEHALECLLPVRQESGRCLSALKCDIERDDDVGMLVLGAKKSEGDLKI